MYIFGQVVFFKLQNKTETHMLLCI